LNTFYQSVTVVIRSPEMQTQGAALEAGARPDAGG